MKKGELITAVILLLIGAALLSYLFHISSSLLYEINYPKGGLNIKQVELYSMFRLDQSQLNSGETLDLGEGDVTSIDINNEAYSIKVLGINPEEKTVNLVINNFLYVYLKLSEERKLDLNSDDTYELLIKVESISDRKTRILFKAINEKKNVMELLDSKMSIILKKLEEDYKIQLNLIIIILSVFLVLLVLYIFKYHLMPEIKFKKMIAKEKSSEVFSYLAQELKKAKNNKSKAKEIYDRMNHLYDHMSNEDKKKLRSKIKDMEKYIN